MIFTPTVNNPDIDSNNSHSRRNLLCYQALDKVHDKDNLRGEDQSGGEAPQELCPGGGVLGAVLLVVKALKARTTVSKPPRYGFYEIPEEKQKPDRNEQKHKNGKEFKRQEKSKENHV